MLASLRKRSEREDEGFTLIELMVVVLIIAILLAIAIPTFLGARERANDRAAQSSLRNALTAAKTLYTDSQDYASADTAAEMTAVEPSLSYVIDTADSTTFKVVSVDVQQGGAATGVMGEWAGAALSKSGKCFYIREVAVANSPLAAGTYFGSNAAGGTAGNCGGDNALGATGSGF